jgi:hypothetical protein
VTWITALSRSLQFDMMGRLVQETFRKTRFLDDGRIELDNDAVERSICPIAHFGYREQLFHSMMSARFI